MVDLDIKLVYLELYDNEMTFYELQQSLFLDNTPQLHRSLRRLCEMKLIYSHPLLLKKRPRGIDFQKLRHINLEVMDRSLWALYWALEKDSTEMIRNKPREWYIRRIKTLAHNDRQEINKQELFRDLSYEFLYESNGLLPLVVGYS